MIAVITMVNGTAITIPANPNNAPPAKTAKMVSNGGN